mmetsp:Transcript_67856/g.112358  ORF Transcript_67856/g.112358 Transcript_67856/m.112358 type:complete len:83 (+) Transcript_67856:89-337(+)
MAKHGCNGVLLQPPLDGAGADRRETVSSVACDLPRHNIHADLRGGSLPATPCSGAGESATGGNFGGQGEAKGPCGGQALAIL